MTTATADEWTIQLSIKHGPKDDRGNPLYMTNVRGYTATDIRDQMADLAEHAQAITEACNQFAALNNVGQHFQTSEVKGQARGVLKARDGELCKPHQLPMRHKSGFKKGTNEYYELLECTASSNPCRPVWPD